MGLRLVLRPRPLCPTFVCDFSSSARNFAYGFLQITSRGGHPCRSANTSYYQACSGLSPPSYCPCRAHHRVEGLTKKPPRPITPLCIPFGTRRFPSLRLDRKVMVKKESFLVFILEKYSGSKRIRQRSSRIKAFRIFRIRFLSRVFGY